MGRPPRLQGGAKLSSDHFKVWKTSIEGRLESFQGESSTVVVWLQHSFPKDSR